MRITATPYLKTEMLDTWSIIRHASPSASAVNAVPVQKSWRLLFTQYWQNAKRSLQQLLPGYFQLILKRTNQPSVTASDTLNVPARFFDAATLEGEAPRLATPSDLVFREVGCHGVSEGAALAAVGAHGTLIAPKMKSPVPLVQLHLVPTQLIFWKRAGLRAV